MIIKYIITILLSMFITTPIGYDDDAIYQINELEFSYTNGYGINENVEYKIICFYAIDAIENCQVNVKEYGKSEEESLSNAISYTELSKVVRMLNKYHILSWKGFSKSDSNVLDGNSFHFYLRYNDDEKLSASGYMKYPQNYDRFKKDFEEFIVTLVK